MKKDQKGFSLIEVLIVVVVLGIIVAIAVPNLLASRRAANEGSAISALRSMHSANAAFQSTNGIGQFAASMAALQSAGFIDSALASATTIATAKSGYYYTYNGAGVTNNPSVFEVVASPAVTTGIAQTGTRFFLIAERGVIFTSSSTGVAPVITPVTRMVFGGVPLDQ